MCLCHPDPHHPPCIRVKQVWFGKLAFLQQNGAMFWPKICDFWPFRATFSVESFGSLLCEQWSAPTFGFVKYFLRFSAVWFCEVLFVLFSTKTRVWGMMRCPNMSKGGPKRAIFGHKKFSFFFLLLGAKSRHPSLPCWQQKHLKRSIPWKHIVRIWALHCSPHRQNYRPDFYYFSNISSNKLATLTLPEKSLGNSVLQSVCSIWKFRIADVQFTDQEWFWELFR